MQLVPAPPAGAELFEPTTVADPIAAIDTANGNSEDDVIDLGGATFVLIDVHNNTSGSNGLPMARSLCPGLVRRSPPALRDEPADGT